MDQKPKKTKAKTFVFDEEELLWPQLEAFETTEELLAAKGMFKFAKIKDRLQLTTAELTKLSRDALRNGVNTYSAYGFGKPKGSQYIVKMSRFSVFFNQLLEQKNNPTFIDASLINEIPETVHNANDLILLQGCFYLKEVCVYSPFKENEEVIKHLVRSQESQEQSRLNNGCWYDEVRREFFLDMELFVDWFFNALWVHK